MSSTNKTTNYKLSQFVGTDVPSYLGDYNSDMSKIDKAIGDVANSQGSVEQSVVGLTAEVQGLSTQVSGMGTSVQQLQTSVAQIDTAYKQADTALSQRITANANNIQTNTTAIESANTAIGNINTAIGTADISGIGDGTIKGAISYINSNLGDNSVIYNEETDSLDVYSNGVKVGSIFCGFKWNGVIFNGTFNESSGITSYEKTAYDGNIADATEVTVFDNKIKLNVKASTNATYVIASPDQKVSLKNYSKLTITGTIEGEMSDVGASGYVGIGTQLPTSKSIFESLNTTLLGTHPKSDTSTTFTKTIDISSFNNEPVYIALYVQSTATSGNRQVNMNISSIVCSN